MIGVYFLELHTMDEVICTIYANYLIFCVHFD